MFDYFTNLLCFLKVNIEIQKILDFELTLLARKFKICRIKLVCLAILKTSTRMPNSKNFLSYFPLFFKFFLHQLHAFLKVKCSCSKKKHEVDANQNSSSATTLIDTRAMTQFDELFKGTIISLLYQSTDHRLNELLQPKNIEASRSMVFLTS